MSIDFNEVYQENLVGTLLVMKILKRGQSSFGSSSFASLIVNISAELASITNNNVGGWYAYRLSKCALNMATKNLVLEFGRSTFDEKPLLFVSMSPGIVNTQMIHQYKK